MRARRGLLALLGSLALSLMAAVPAFAHPLGNFTISRFSQIQLNGNRIDVLYVVDYAEIPAFQEKQRIADDPGYLAQRGGQLAQGLVLEVGVKRLSLVVGDQSVAFASGQGGLQTMRLQVLLSTTLPTASTQSAVYRDTNYSGRLGWKEIVVQQAGGARLLRSTAPSSSVSEALRRYPQDMLTSPLDETEARFTFTPSLQLAPSARSSLPRSAMVSPNSSLHLGPLSDRFAALIAPSHASSSLLVFSLLAAIALGALHALSPGHGKAVMAAYLVGARGTARHAVQLGLTITATHTAGVFALGLVTLYAASIVTPERIYPWVTLLSGSLIVAIGSVLLLSRARTVWHGHEHHDHGTRDHQRATLGRRSLLALGISSGIIPCPSALVVLLAAVSLHRVVFGILLIVAFSAGLAVALTGIGLALAGGLPLLLRARGLKSRRIVGRSARLVPIASALVVTVAGLGLTLQAIPGVR